LGYCSDRLEQEAEYMGGLAFGLQGLTACGIGHIPRTNEFVSVASSYAM
jgi:hypothetical protein